METNYTKTPRVSSYNIMAKGQIIANADINFAGEQALLEIFPYADKLQAAGLALLPEADWQDAQEVASGSDPLPLIRKMLGSMIKSFRVFNLEITIAVRKEVFELHMQNGAVDHSLVMIYDLQPFVTESRQHQPAIVVHDPEQFDLWRFEPSAPDEVIVRELRRYLR